MTNKRRRLEPDDRRTEVMRAAVHAANAFGYTAMTRSQIAVLAGVSGPLVAVYLGEMPEVRRAVVRYAIKREHLGIIAQALALKDPEAAKVSEALRRRACRSLV